MSYAGFFNSVSTVVRLAALVDSFEVFQPYSFSQSFLCPCP